MTPSQNKPASEKGASELAILDELFPENSQEIQTVRSVLTTVFNQFNITDDFNYNIEFLIRLEYILNIGLTHKACKEWGKFDDVDFSGKWSKWYKSISAARISYESVYGKAQYANDLIRKTGSKEADCLFQQLREETYEHQIGLLLLYVAFLIIYPYRSEGFNLKEITRNFTSATTFESVFGHLPLDYRNRETEAFLKDLSSSCQKIITLGQFGEAYEIFLRQLDDIARLFLTGKYKRGAKDSTELEPTSDSSSKTSAPHHRDRPYRFTKFQDEAQGEDISPIGTFEAVVWDPSEEPIQGLIDSVTDTPDRLLMPKVNREAELRVGSKFWIQNYTEAIPWNNNGINPVTRKILVSWVKENRSQIAALIFALMLATGLKIPSLLSLVIGKEQDIGFDNDNLDGLYRRRYKPPPKHYSPDERTEHLLIETQKSFTVRLPDLVTSMLRNYVTDESENILLSEVLGVSVDEAEKQVSSVIKKLIKEGATGLARDRIHLCLRKHLSMISGDEFIGYLLTGSEKEAPPVSSYYSRVSLSHIQSLYDKALSELFA